MIRPLSAVMVGYLIGSLPPSWALVKLIFSLVVLVLIWRSARRFAPR